MATKTAEAETAKWMDLDPGEAARKLVKQADEKWLSEFKRSLRLQGQAGQDARDELARVLAVWGLSRSEAARLFGVTRQALSKWLQRGVPENRFVDVGNLSAATDFLVRYLKPARIPAVVRRAAPGVPDGGSLLDLVAAGRTGDTLSACRAMFDFAGVHA